MRSASPAAKTHAGPRLSAAALYWADGRRRLTEIQELTQHEFATLNVDLTEYFTYLAQHGYVGGGF